MQQWFGMTGNWLTFRITVACATDMALFGNDQGVFGGVVVTQNFLGQLNTAGNTTMICECST
ncbi:hypothetical protein P154DRAFT_619977 [Amniculicola lignicola CBS 123094]|uniref:Uncharacterized protein n=1 Tax=Amniculicola lignicola CBS 123094 TaxID=1392246 RepID=A0A6A5WH24_9PLEO|nr:hypothetical protein P154DRAFT_619977 [Amniculicola lignicola CBS 123094]